MPMQPMQNISASPPLNLDELAGRCLGRMDLVEKVLGRFRDSLGLELQKLQQAVFASDSEEIARLAHRIKGTSLTVSAPRLSQCARDLESNAAGSFETIEQCLIELREECARLDDLIANRLSGVD